jgi:hypothetical protein
MKYIIRKYSDPYNKKGIFRLCIGVLGCYNNKAEAKLAFWSFQISAFRERKDFLYRSEWAMNSKFKYEREKLITYINEKYPFLNEYYYPDSEFSLNNFIIPDELSDDDIKYFSELTQLFFYEIFEFEENVEFYVPITDRKVKDYNGNLIDIDFTYFGEEHYGTCSYVYELFARQETEQYLSSPSFKIEEGEIKESYKLLKLNYQEYVDFRYNELSRILDIQKDYEFWTYEMGKSMEFISNMYQLPIEYLKEKLIQE